jgi:hypothetical protein
MAEVAASPPLYQVHVLRQNWNWREALSQDPPLYLYFDTRIITTYDHRLKRIGHPVRSAIHKLEIGGLVVGWVTTSEYPLLYVFVIFFAIFVVA